MFWFDCRKQRYNIGAALFCQAEDGIRDDLVTGVQTCALPISRRGSTAGGCYCLRVRAKVAAGSIAHRSEVCLVPKLSRRSFLERTASLAAGAVALGRARAEEASGPNLRFPTSASERLAVASWPFRASIESPKNRWARNPKLAGMDLKNF